MRACGVWQAESSKTERAQLRHFTSSASDRLPTTTHFYNPTTNHDPPTQETTAFPAPQPSPAAARRLVLLAPLLLLLLLLLINAAAAAAFIPTTTRPARRPTLTTMSEQPPAATAASSGGAHPHPQHALPVAPKHGAASGEKKKQEKFQLGFLGGGMMASALIRGLIKAEVGGLIMIAIGLMHRGREEAD